MQRKHVLGAVVVPVLLVCGCDSMSHTENGALAGGGIGALAGAVIGGATGHAGVGAAIGAGAGALTGAAVGNSVDKQERRADARAAQVRAMVLNDVVQMTHDHVNDVVIINQIRSSGTIFYLSGAEINWLKQNGVSDTVIIEMQATANRYPRRVFVEPVYVEPPPPPVSIGFGYSRGWR